MVREMPDGTLKLTLSLATPVAECKGGKLPSRWGRCAQYSGFLVARLADTDDEAIMKGAERGQSVLFGARPACGCAWKSRRRDKPMVQSQSLAGLLGAALLSLGNLLSCASLVAAAASQETPAAIARQIFDATGIDGGLIVHVGCSDGKPS